MGEFRTFISEPSDGLIFIAEQVRKGSSKLIWSVMPEHGCGDSVIASVYVPLNIRRKADLFFGFLMQESA